MDTITIPRRKAIRLLNELAHTVRKSDFENLDFYLRLTPHDSDFVTNDPSLIEAYNFFNDVGMLGD